MSTRIGEHGTTFLISTKRTFRPPEFFLQINRAFYDHAQDLWPLIYTGCTVASVDSPLSNLVMVF
jgi:hypothetical protein